MTSDLNAALRAIARRDQLCFNDQGRLVPVDQIETPESDNPEPERHAEGSGDGGRGNDIPESRPTTRTFNDVLRRAAGGA